MDGFVNISGYPEYLVNREGVVYDTVLKRNLKLHVTGSGYPYVCLREDGKTYSNVLLHRILAIAFIRNRDVSRNMVNHIDGNKLNYKLDNLEWVTCKENTWHAYATGLRTSHYETSTAISVRDVNTLEVTHYPTSREAGRVLGLNKDSVQRRAMSDGQRTWPDNKQYKFKSSVTDWSVPDMHLGHGKCRRIQARNLLSNEVQEFDSQGVAAKFFKLSEGKISMVMNQDNPVLPGKWQLRYATVKDWLPIDDYYELLEKSLNGRCCAVWNNGHAFIYETCLEGAKAFKVSPTSFNYRLSTAGKSLIKGFYYAYYSDYKKITGSS